LRNLGTGILQVSGQRHDSYPSVFELIQFLVDTVVGTVQLRLKTGDFG